MAQAQCTPTFRFSVLGSYSLRKRRMFALETGSRSLSLLSSTSWYSCRGGCGPMRLPSMPGLSLMCSMFWESSSSVMALEGLHAQHRHYHPAATNTPSCSGLRLTEIHGMAAAVHGVPVGGLARWAVPHAHYILKICPH